MSLTDTHIHLYAEEFADNLDELLIAAFSKSIQRFVIPNIDSSSIDPMLAICNTYKSNCFPTLGLHPCYVKENAKAELLHIYKRMQEQKIVGIGEIGMDFYWDKSFIKEQEQAFILQLEWAHDAHLPVIIHSRESTDAIIAILQAHAHLQSTGIFHCFSGTNEQAKKIIDLGFYLGIGGVLTFKRSGLDSAIADIGIQHLVLETDAPYLAPAPHRGKRNEPAFLFLVAEKLASLKNISVEEAALITSENAARIFSF